MDFSISAWNGARSTALTQDAQRGRPASNSQKSQGIIPSIFDAMPTFGSKELYQRVVCFFEYFCDNIVNRVNNTSMKMRILMWRKINFVATWNWLKWGGLCANEHTRLFSFLFAAMSNGGGCFTYKKNTVHQFEMRKFCGNFYKILTEYPFVSTGLVNSWTLASLYINFLSNFVGSGKCRRQGSLGLSLDLSVFLN